MLLTILLQYSHYIVTSQSIILLTILSLYILSPYNPSSSSPPIKLPTKLSFSLTNRHHRKPPHGYLTYPPPSVRLNRVHRHTGSHARHAYQLSPTIPLSSHTIPHYSTIQLYHSLSPFPSFSPHTATITTTTTSESVPPPSPRPPLICLPIPIAHPPLASTHPSYWPPRNTTTPNAI